MQSLPLLPIIMFITKKREVPNGAQKTHSCNVYMDEYTHSLQCHKLPFKKHIPV